MLSLPNQAIPVWCRALPATNLTTITSPSTAPGISREPAMDHLRMCAVALLIFLLHYSITTHAQPAASPAPPGPLNVTAILEKAGQFNTLIRLLKSTQVGDQIDTQLNNSNTGMTIFAPTDSAFSSLSPGALNSLTDQQKVALIQFHVLPSVVSISQFQTVSNPLRTQAGNANNGQYPLNVTTKGNQVNISTGVVNTTVSNTIYSDSQLAVYQVDKVLLPLDLFGHPAAPAPAPVAAKKRAADGPSSSPAKDTAEDSSAVSLDWRRSGLRVLPAALVLAWWSL